MREHGGPARDQPPDQRDANGDHSRDRRHTGQHPEPVRGDSHGRVQQSVAVDHQQHVSHDVDQGGDAEHQHAQEQRGANDRRRRSCLRRLFGRGRSRFDAVRQAPARDHGVARSGTQGPPSTSLRRWGAGAHRYPPETRRQPRRSALQSGGPGRPGRRRAAVRTPSWVGRRRVRQGRHQRPATAGTPLTSALAHVPPRAAVGAHLDHRTSLAPATIRAADAAR